MKPKKTIKAVKCWVGKDFFIEKWPDCWRYELSRTAEFSGMVRVLVSPLKGAKKK